MKVTIAADHGGFALRDRLLQGDHTLFARDDGVERVWKVVKPALDNPASLCTHPAGSRGPAEADDLIAPRKWHLR